MALQRRTRPPAVAGQFYAASADGLRSQIDACYRHPLGPGEPPRVNPEPLSRSLGLMLPHAGYVYSGPVAARGLYALASQGTPAVAIIIGPNHWGVGPDVALPEENAWQTPLGDAAVERELALRIGELLPGAKSSSEVHRCEHSMEVQVPLLQHLYGLQLPILPIAISRQDLATSLSLGRALAQVLADMGALVIASCDLTHYLPQERANALDRLLLDAVLTGDPAEVERVVSQQGLTTCGPGPTMAMLEACRLLGATRARLLAYATSGDTSGDYSQVVGYAAILVA